MKPQDIAEIKLEERGYNEAWLVYVKHSGWPAKEVKVPYTKRYEVLHKALHGWFQALKGDDDD